jgi:magnesium chelatase accessory protein
VSKPDWTTAGRDWPNRDASRFVTAAGLRWHVQAAGEGPVALLLHGTGAATHSWAGLLPHLTRRFRVVAPDLPGHGFTDTPDRTDLSLPGMAARVAGLLNALEVRPAVTVAHSAGAAIALRLALDGTVAGPVVALNGALAPFAGATGPLFQGLARALFANPFAAWLFSLQARDPRRVERLIEGTGSRLPAEGLEFYRRLFMTEGHVAATLNMMANWDLDPLRRDLPTLRAPLVLVVGERDRAVPPRVSRDVASSVPGAQVVSLPGLGHLAHEERPDLIAEIVERVAREHGAPASEESR